MTRLLGPLTVSCLLTLRSLSGCNASAGPSEGGSGGTVAAPAPGPGQQEAIFAAGCFWCAESDFEKALGVISVESGYAGGKVAHPSYDQVSAGVTGHAEAVRVLWDPQKTSYDALLQWFWTHSDPLDGGGQFCDRGGQYRPVIFPRDAAQRAGAEASKRGIETRINASLPVTIEDPGTFWLAETYHQDFHEKSPVRYLSYRQGCGRDARIDEVRKRLFPTGG